MNWTQRRVLRDLCKQAYAAWEQEAWPRAGELLEQAAAMRPGGKREAVLWFDAALAYKFARDWPKAYALGKVAAAKAPARREEPAHWNLGIAATVLRDWATARECWAAYGLELPDGEGEIVADLGMTPVRIETPSGQEVVWAQRLCPTRARIMSVPFDPARRFGEVVLHDGVPNGERVLRGTAFAVFDEIMLFERSELPTLSVTVSAATPADVEELVELFIAAELGAEPASNGRILCRCCSERSVATGDSPGGAQTGQQTVLVGAPREAAEQLLDQWRSATAHGRSWHELQLAT